MQKKNTLGIATIAHLISNEMEVIKLFSKSFQYRIHV